MFRIALKSTLARRGRLFSTALAVVISVAFITGTMVLSDSVEGTVGDLVSASYRGIDAVVRSTSAQESQFGGPAYREPIGQEALDLSAATSGVRVAEGVVLGAPILLAKDGSAVGTAGLSNTVGTGWIADDGLRGRRLERGRAPRTQGEVTLDAPTATKYHFELGDEVTLQAIAGSGRFRIVGITDAGSAADRSVGAAEVRFLPSEAQRLFRKDGGWDYVAVAAKPDVSPARLVAAIERRLPDGAEAVTGERFVAESQEQISRVIDLVTTFVLAFGWISLFVGVFVIANTFSIIVAQRIRELALLRAVGASRAQILGSVLTEATAVGLVAALVGIASGYLLAVVLGRVLGAFLTLPTGAPTLGSDAVLLGLAVGVLATVTAASVPAVWATRVPPVAAMGEVGVDRAARSAVRAVIGGMLAVGGIVIVVIALAGSSAVGTPWLGAGAAMLFTSVAVGGPVLVPRLSRWIGAPIERSRGVTGRLAHQNAARNPRRTAVAAAALTIGVGLVAAIATFAASLQGSLSDVFATQLARVDAVIDAGTGDTGVPVEVRPALADLPGVAEVTSIRWTPLTVLNSKDALARQREAASATDPPSSSAPVGEPRWILGVDASTMLRMVTVEGLTPAISDLGRDELMVARSVATTNGWKVGDRVEVNFPHTGRQTLRIVATFDTRLSGGEYFVDLSTFDANALPELLGDSQVWVRLRPGTTVESALPEIDAVLDRLAPAAQVNDVQSFIAGRSALFDPLLGTIYALLALAIVIALFGVADTISLSILERTRELGLLRAVGMTRAQVRAAVRWESAIIALVGTLGGIVIGTGLAVAFVTGLGENGVQPIVPWGQLLVIALAGAAAGVLTAVRPARRAASVDVLDALHAI